MQANRLRVSLMLPLLAGGFLLLGACGGGGGGAAPSGGDPVTINIPPPDGGLPTEPPPTNPPPTNPPPTNPPPTNPPPTDPPPTDPPPTNPPPTNPPPAVPALPTFPSYADYQDVHGVALDPASGAVYAVRSGGGDLLRLAPGATEPAAVGPVPLPNVRALTYDVNSDMLYAVSDDGAGGDDVLHAINPTTGEPSLLGTITGYSAVEGLAFHGVDAARRLYAVDTEHDVLLTLDTASGLPTSVGPMGGLAQDVRGLASLSDEGLLLGVDGGRGDVVSLDTATGRAQHKVTLTQGPLRGFTYAASERSFYCALPDNTLQRIDIQGHWIGWDGIKGLTYDASADVLYGVHTGFGLIVRADPASGWRTPVVQIQDAGLEGLALNAGEPMLHAISRSTGALYRIRPADGDVQSDGILSSPQGPWTGLASLAFADGKLYAIDTATANLLEITPATRGVVTLANVGGQSGLQSLTYDEPGDRLLAYAEGSRTVFALSRRAGGAVQAIAQAAFPRIGGLAWIADERRLVGSDLAGAALVTVLQEAAPGLGYEEVHGLARSAELFGFDNATQKLLAIDATTGVATEGAAHAGLRLEGLAHDALANVTYAVNAADASLMAIADDGSITHRGAVGALSGVDVRALAFDPTTPPGVLYGFDNTARTLVTIDMTTGAPTAVGAAIAPASIEAMVWIPGAPSALLAVDRSTRMLMELDPATGTPADIAELGFDDVRGMTSGLLPEELVIVDATLDSLAIIDRFTGDVIEDFDGGGVQRSGGDAAALLLFPRGAVRPQLVKSLGVNVDATYGNDADLVLRRGKKLLLRAPFKPETATSVFKLPAEARKALSLGGKFTWGLEFNDKREAVMTTFTLVQSSVGAKDLAALKASPHVRKQKLHVFATRSARILLRHGLTNEAALVAARALNLAPDSKSAERELRRALHVLFGKEAGSFTQPFLTLAREPAKPAPGKKSK